MNLATPVGLRARKPRSKVGIEKHGGKEIMSSEIWPVHLVVAASKQAPGDSFWMAAKSDRTRRKLKASRQSGELLAAYTRGRNAAVGSAKIRGAAAGAQSGAKTWSPARTERTGPGWSAR
jgi:hypothetical protein